MTEFATDLGYEKQFKVFIWKIPQSSDIYSLNLINPM